MIDVEYRPCHEKKSSRIVVLVNDHRRLNDEVHDKVIKRWQEWLPYDMYIHRHNEREEYALVDSKSHIQHLKHWWSLQQLPDDVKYVVKVRNDIEFEDGLMSSLRNLLAKVEVYCEKRELITIGFGTMGWYKHWVNINRPDDMPCLGDLILFHPIECYQNPYQWIDEFKDNADKKTAHHWWGRLLTGRKHQIDWHIKRVYR